MTREPSGLIRIRFKSDEDRIKGNYLLTTKSCCRRLRGNVFEIAEQDLDLLNANQLHYEIIPVPEPTRSEDQTQNIPMIRERFFRL